MCDGNNYNSKAGRWRCAASLGELGHACPSIWFLRACLGTVAFFAWEGFVIGIADQQGVRGVGFCFLTVGTWFLSSALVCG